MRDINDKSDIIGIMLFGFFTIIIIICRLNDHCVVEAFSGKPCKKHQQPIQQNMKTTVVTPTTYTIRK